MRATRSGVRGRVAGLLLLDDDILHGGGGDLLDAGVGGETGDAHRELVGEVVAAIGGYGFELLLGDDVVTAARHPEGYGYAGGDDTQVYIVDPAVGHDGDGEGLFVLPLDGDEQPHTVGGGMEVGKPLPHFVERDGVPAAVGEGFQDSGVGGYLTDFVERGGVAVKPYGVGLDDRVTGEPPAVGKADVDILQFGDEGFATPFGKGDAQGFDRRRDRDARGEMELFGEVGEQEAVDFEDRVARDTDGALLVSDGMAAGHGLEIAGVDGDGKCGVGIGDHVAGIVKPFPSQRHGKGEVAMLGHGGHEPYKSRNEQYDPERLVSEHDSYFLSFLGAGCSGTGWTMFFSTVTTTPLEISTSMVCSATSWTLP